MIWSTVLVCLAFAPRLLASELFFETDVRPILKAACFHCHGEEGEKEGGLDVRLVRLLVAGGESGSVLKPGDLAGSLMWEKLAADEMPKGEKKLSAGQKEVIRKWIEQGAKTARPEPENVEEARFTIEELEHWSFQPVAQVTPPEGKNPIDAFIKARLSKVGLSPSSAADRRTLMRRVSFGVTGLPPSAEEVEDFANDPDSGAYGKLVDRLLASPQYGVRWARHWLDAAGYAESDGNALSDPKREHAWRYRDYVIDSFNKNKPVNEFIIEQLAGDELLEGEIAVDNARHLELLTATGYLRMAPDGTQRSNTLTDRNSAVASSMQVVSTSLLGVTVGCAQCHDHKYDPIGIDDYYAFRAIFDPAFPLTNWKQPSSRLVDMTSAKVVAERAKIESEAKTLQDDYEARRRGHGTAILEEKLAAVPDDIRESVRAAVLVEPGKRSEEQKNLLATYPMVKTVNFILGQLVEYDGKAFAEFEKERKKIAEVRTRKPPLRMVMTTTEPAGALPVSKVFFRGDPESPRRVVEPAELMVLRRQRPAIELPQKSESLKTTGRRLAYARQLTDGSHPLTARVFVNRIWMHHFGRGIVATPGDFGLAGERPSHPKLLDWLARDFVEHGWNLKRLHRMILLSDTYRQRSQRRPEHDKIDPENALLARANLRRLEAEAIRDALLSVSGKLNSNVGGLSSPVSANGEGKAILGGDKNRRSIFVEVQRRLPLNMLETFDQPVMTPNCNQRRQTTVAMQALWFLNDAEVVAHAEALAKSLQEESQFTSVQLTNLSLRLFARPPTAGDLRAYESHLAEQRSHFAKEGEKAGVDQRALASLCQVLLASNRFLYLD